MKTTLPTTCIAAVTLVCASAVSARTEASSLNALETDDGPVLLRPVEHASFVMDWGGHTLYIDPVGGAERYGKMGAPDIVFITHAHGDHLDMDTLRDLDTSDATLVMPQSVADEIGGKLGKERLVMDNGDTAEKRGITIRAVPMYNLPASQDAYHPKGWGNGYVLTLGGKHIYISGDTEGIPEMRSLENIDLAFVCMNLPYTMDSEHAAEAVLAFEPNVVYPYHYRGQDTKKFKQLVNESSDAVEVRLHDWYPH